MDVLGHADIRTTMIYAHTNLESQKVVFKHTTAGKVTALYLQTSPPGEGKGE